MNPEIPSAFFQNQTLFLTGGTGGLGGCLLFKLATKVDVRKIYVLVRGSAARAITQWSATMPHQIEALLATGKIHLVVGDTTQSNCGIDPAVLAEMADTVSIVIHAAGNINLNNALKQTVRDNCVSTLGLAQIASSFKHLRGFIYISSAYANSFLPDGLVEERIYEAGDAETQLSEILEKDAVPDPALAFLWPYSFAKHLTERLLLSRYPRIPVLIVRPTLIAPAIYEPYPYYGPPGSFPVSTYIRTFMEAPDSGVGRVSPRHPTASNILDEIPVDIVANLILLHAMHGTTGIVHAGAQSYVPRSLAQMLSDILVHFPREHESPAPQFRPVTDQSVKEGRYARIWQVAGREWHFSNAASRPFAEIKGPLRIAFDDHDVGKFMSERARLIAEEVIRRRVAKL
ncbi:male sterility protein-domain-containing protein [Mycena capillaripes]|nr:male sterility protein-domain-containing protein [Mycena capillaripes]